MQRSDVPLAIVQHTPLWVWVLLVALLSLGLQQSLPRSVSLRRATLLPVSMLTLSLWGVLSAFGSALAVTAWVLGGLVAAAWSLHADSPRGVHWSAAEQVFRMPGSWMPLVLILGLFSIKFGIGVSLARHPELSNAAGLALAASLAYGIFSGLFAGRALVLWRLARRPPTASSA